MSHQHVDLAGQVSTLQLLQVDLLERGPVLQPARVRDGRGWVALCFRVQRLHHQPLPAGGATSERDHPVEEREREKRLLWKWGKSKDEKEGGKNT